MKPFLIALILPLLMLSATSHEGYHPGDQAIDFNLKNTDGKMVSMAQFDKAKGFIVVFTCNHCPFSKKYEDRIIALDKQFKPSGFPVIAINPNDASQYPDDDFDNMKKRAKEKGFTFPYLADETQQIAKTYGASRTPHVFVLSREQSGLIVKYIGAIDDNADDPAAVKEKYVEQAIAKILKNEPVAPSFTKAIGCTIKWKKN